MAKVQQSFSNNKDGPIYVSMEPWPECFELEPGEKLTLIGNAPESGGAAQIDFINERELVVCAPPRDCGRNGFEPRYDVTEPLEADHDHEPPRVSHRNGRRARGGQLGCPGAQSGTQGTNPKDRHRRGVCNAGARQGVAGDRAHGSRLDSRQRN